MPEIKTNSVASGVKAVISEILTNGQTVKRRVGPWCLQDRTTSRMKELHGCQLILTEPENRWYNKVTKGLVVELFDELLGENPGYLHKYWSLYRQWIGANNRYPYTYGERLMTEQWKKAVDIIKRDDTSRHALVLIRRPEDIEQEYTPCSIALEFQINEDDELDMFYQMRSNDAGSPGGLARNLFLNCHLFEQFCLDTGYPMGQYYHYATNMHIYESDYDKARNLADTIESSTFHTNGELLSNETKTYVREAFDLHFSSPPRELTMVNKVEEKSPYFASLLNYIFGFNLQAKDIPELLWLTS